jgi:hypothetical protein
MEQAVDAVSDIPPLIATFVMPGGEQPQSHRDIFAYCYSKAGRP